MSNQFSSTFWQSFFGERFFPDPQRYIDDFKMHFPRVNRIWGQKDAIWIDTEEAYNLYIEIPELRAIVDKRASMMSANVPVLYNADGERVDNHWILDLIKKPNPNQSWEDVIYSLSVNDALYSSSFAYCPKRSFNIRNLIVPLPTDKVQIKLSGKKLKQMEKEGLIDGFIFQYSEDSEKIPLDDMVFLTTTDGVNIVNPSSRIQSLKYPLSNIRAAYHKRNVLLENIGAIGILSARNSDMGGAIPMDPDEKKAIQKSWYRRQKDEVIITESDVQWNPMSFPTKDLMLFEEMTSDKLAIIDAYGLNPYLFSQEQGATFSNVKEGVRMAYTDTIIPETIQMYNTISHQLGLNEEGLILVPDFSHIPVMQPDEKLKAETMNLRADAIKKIIEAGVELNEDEIRELSGLNQ
jgi:hypothetical protein